MNLYSIPPSEPFLPSLAQGLRQRYGAGKARPLLLLPTKEACDRFKACEPDLCKIVALGDLGYFFGLYGQGLPKPIPTLQRQILAQQWLMIRAGIAQPSLALVQSLFEVLDEFYVNQQPLERLLTIKIGEWADYWRLTLGRLQQFVQEWPKLLAKHGYSEAVLLQQILFDRLSQAWQKNPPAHPVIIAGTRGSRPVISHLLASILQLPQGAVVLPPFDPAMMEQPLPIHHPVWAIQHLCQTLAIDPATVPTWTISSAPTKGSLPIMQEVMRPAATTDQWCHLQPKSFDSKPDWHLVACSNRQQEARLIMQWVKDHAPSQRLAIVTADSLLAEALMVHASTQSVKLYRRQQTNLGHSGVGEVLKRFCQCWTQEFAPATFLNLVQHPLITMGMDQVQWQNWVQHLNHHILRGPKPAAGWPGLYKMLQHHQADIARKFEELWSGYGQDLTGVAWLDCVGQTLITLCDPHQWAAEGGEALHQIVNDLKKLAVGLTKDQIQLLLFQALAQKPWPEEQPSPDRQQVIDLLTPTQARLLDYDVWILAGCQEGTWPQTSSGSLWLNHMMRHHCGLPSKDWVMGHAAHDFCWPLWQGKKVFITFHQQENGVKSQASRWLQRLEFVLDQYGWQQILQADQNQEDKHPLKITLPPAPKPPLEARPTIFSISDISCWRRNPYHFYAEKILQLKPIEPLEADPDGADYGQRLHQVLEDFVRQYPHQLPDNAEAILCDLGRQVLGDFADKPSLWQLWWPRFCQIAKWFIGHETDYRTTTRCLGAEVPAQMAISLDQGTYILKGIIDRLDQDVDGTIHLIDYKTGSLPTMRDMVLGMAPQLPLETCLILDELTSDQTIHLHYWQLQGAYEGGKARRMSDEGQVLAHQALEGLKTMITEFAQAQTPYLAHPFADWPPFASAYDHLARVDAWRWNIQDGDTI